MFPIQPSQTKRRNDWCAKPAQNHGKNPHNRHDMRNKIRPAITRNIIYDTVIDKIRIRIQQLAYGKRHHDRPIIRIFFTTAEIEYDENIENQADKKVADIVCGRQPAKCSSNKRHARPWHETDKNRHFIKKQQAECRQYSHTSRGLGACPATRRQGIGLRLAAQTKSRLTPIVKKAT